MMQKTTANNCLSSSVQIRVFPVISSNSILRDFISKFLRPAVQPQRHTPKKWAASFSHIPFLWVTEYGSPTGEPLAQWRREHKGAEPWIHLKTLSHCDSFVGCCKAGVWFCHIISNGLVNLTYLPGG